MAKKNKNSKSPASKQMVVKRKPMLKVPRGLSPAAEYAHLLLDPCNAPLCASPYELGTAATVVRTQTLRTNGAIYGAYFWHPVFGLFGADSATDVATSLSWLTPPALQGGASRAIAGCVSTSFIAQETIRAGTVHCGIVPGSHVWTYMQSAAGGNGSTMTFSDFASRIGNMERMPVDRCEVNWFPSEGDADPSANVFPTATQNNTVQSAFGKVNFVAVVLLSVAQSNSVQLKFTAVIENGNTANTIWTVAPKASPPFDWKRVVESLAAKDPTWFLNTFRKIGTFIGGAAKSYATMGLPGALGYLTSSVAGIFSARNNFGSFNPK